MMGTVKTCPCDDSDEGELSLAACSRRMVDCGGTARRLELDSVDRQRPANGGDFAFGFVSRSLGVVASPFV